MEKKEKKGNTKTVTNYNDLEKFGLLGKTGIDLPGEAKGIFLDKSKVGPVELATISFGQRFEVKDKLCDIRAKYSENSKEELEANPYYATVAGRIMFIRKMGKASFFSIQDKTGKIIAKGYHKKCGELHAERNAIASLTEPANGATIYVTLEPCCHYGKTPPCTEAIIENGITRVFVGSKDPNPLVAGKGVNRLREAGIEVIEDFLEDECDELNPVFFHYIFSLTEFFK